MRNLIEDFYGLLCLFYRSSIALLWVFYEFFYDFGEKVGREEAFWG